MSRRRRIGLKLLPLPSRSQREAIRTNLWLVPAAMTIVVGGLFALTLLIDQMASSGTVRLPSWITFGGATAARQILIAVAATIMTVAGVTFSITILVLQLASQQFGPRMLRNFIRDLGTQVSLGSFVATFVYSVLALAAVSNPISGPEFVPHFTATFAVGLLLVDLGVLIYFIDHVATSIQLTSVVSGIAQDFRNTVAAVRADAARLQVEERPGGPDLHSVARLVAEEGVLVHSPSAGFLQGIGHTPLLEIAASSNAVIRLLHRPGHFLALGQPLAYVMPAGAHDLVSKALARAHIVGPNRTLTQDPGFAIDQLVEVALRALSQAINDTFTALNCIDWLGDCLCRAAAAPLPSGVYRDPAGEIRLIEPALSLERLIKGATDKIRQASIGMPAILIRQLENLRKVIAQVSQPEHLGAVIRHADLILATAERSIPEPADLDDIRTAHQVVLVTGRMIVEIQGSTPEAVIGEP